jgi:hypothetical protein
VSGVAPWYDDLAIISTLPFFLEVSSPENICPPSTVTMVIPNGSYTILYVTFTSTSPFSGMYDRSHRSMFACIRVLSISPSADRGTDSDVRPSSEHVLFIDVSFPFLSFQYASELIQEYVQTVAFDVTKVEIGRGKHAFARDSCWYVEEPSHQQMAYDGKLVSQASSAYASVPRRS